MRFRRAMTCMSEDLMQRHQVVAILVFIMCGNALLYIWVWWWNKSFEYRV